MATVCQELPCPAVLTASDAAAAGGARFQRGPPRGMISRVSAVVKSLRVLQSSPLSLFVSFGFALRELEHALMGQSKQASGSARAIFSCRFVTPAQRVEVRAARR